MSGAEVLDGSEWQHRSMLSRRKPRALEEAAIDDLDAWIEPLHRRVVAAIVGVQTGTGE